MSVGSKERKNGALKVVGFDILSLDKGKKLLLEEGLRFWMYLCFYSCILASIHVCGCFEGVFIWVLLHVCKMTL